MWKRLLFVSCFFLITSNNIFSAVDPNFINETNAKIETLRKGTCKIVVKKDGVILSSKNVNIKQIKNHFGFGAAITKKYLSSPDSQLYRDAFLRYFEWATPENEMKWTYTDEADDYQNYADADYIIEWCKKNDINVRGHCLFWNESEIWIPQWARALDTTNFRIAMELRINNAVSHFKGKLKHWDAINEIIHFKGEDGVGGKIKIPGLLAIKSGKADVFSWIIKKTREIDPDVKIVVNEYNIIEKYSNAKEYIQEIKNIESQGGKIDIVGVEGHFGTSIERTRYKERLDTVASALPHPIWLTEVDFAVDKSIRADKMEELMRTCFAHQKVEGIILWVWWGGHIWDPGLTSFLVDSNFTENDLGERWRKVRDEWKTNTKVSTATDGRLSFKGFYGKYVVYLEEDSRLFIDTIYFEPNKNEEIVVDLKEEVSSKAIVIRNKEEGRKVYIKGNKISLLTLPLVKEPFNFSLYSVKGRLLYRYPIQPYQKFIELKELPAGLFIGSIEGRDRRLYSFKVIKGKN
ncbi:MAG: endo-1,4-beta-xylanase [Chitinispirillaceae bacterium]|nr:endo-1,4-beta-xylanase [Chitinispirillaceae bacterium]